MPEGIDTIMKQYASITAIASSGILDNRSINGLLSSLLTIDRMLSDYYDPPYRDLRAKVAGDFQIIHEIQDNGKYLKDAYTAALAWIGAISGLMGRKGWLAPSSTIISEDYVGGETPEFLGGSPREDTDE